MLRMPRRNSSAILTLFARVHLSSNNTAIDRSTLNDFIITGFSAGARFWTERWTRRKFNGAGKFAAPEVADETLIYGPSKLWRIVGRWRGFFLSMRLYPFVVEFWEKSIVFENNNNNNKIGIIMKKCIKSFNFSIFISLKTGVLI